MIAMFVTVVILTLSTGAKEKMIYMEPYDTMVACQEDMYSKLEDPKQNAWDHYAHVSEVACRQVHRLDELEEELNTNKKAP